MTRSIAAEIATASHRCNNAGAPSSHQLQAMRGLEDKPGIAREIKVSPRTIDNYMALRIIPFFRIGRVVRFDVARVKAALARFEVREAGYRRGGR
jgi:hypothetical protein